VTNARKTSVPSPPVSVMPDTQHRGCPVGELFAMLGQPHMLGLLHAFDASGDRPIRFRDLQARLQISPKTLSQRLRTLVEAGLLSRTAYNEIPPRVEYAPTPKAKELGPLFEVLEDWARRNELHAVPTISVVGRMPA
jgi:DNA-binding HxlR family transcriptional regulator